MSMPSHITKTERDHDETGGYWAETWCGEVEYVPRDTVTDDGPQNVTCPACLAAKREDEAG